MCNHASVVELLQKFVAYDQHFSYAKLACDLQPVGILFETQEHFFLKAFADNLFRKSFELH